jgi:hypothetical protein
MGAITDTPLSTNLLAVEWNEKPVRIKNGIFKPSEKYEGGFLKLGPRNQKKKQSANKK